MTTTPEVIVPKPAVALVIGAVTQRLASTAYVGTLVAGTRPSETGGYTGQLPKRWVRITRSGGGMLNRVTDNVRLLVECWSDDSVDCEALANTVRGAITSLAGCNFSLGHVRGVEAGDDGPSQFADPLVPDHDRWQFQITVLVSTN